MKQSFVKYILGILCFVFLLVPSSVFAGNTAPIARDDNATTNKNTVVVIDVMANDEDPDGGNISLTKITVQASHGTAEIKNGKVEYTPENGYTGSDSFEYEIKDDDGGWFDSDKTDTATVTITINDVPNIAPNAVDDSADTKENNAVTINVLANDTDDNGDTLSVTSTSNGPSHGSVTVNSDNTITYTPDSGYYGSDSFDYTISDGNGGEDTATVTVNVLHVKSVSKAPVCMESISYGKKDGVASGCFNADGVFQGGTGCLQKLKLRNLSTDNITASDLLVDYSNFDGTLDNTCGIDGVDETGHDCNVTSSPDNAIFDPFKDFSEYKTHSIYLGIANANNGSTPFEEGHISMDYKIDGDWYNAPVEKCQIESTTSKDLCYDKTESDGLMCMDMGDFFKGGIGCKTTIYLRNQGDSTLYSPSVDLLTDSMMDGHMMSDCGIDGQSGNCSDSDVMDMGFIGMSGMGMGSSITYDPMPDFDKNNTHTTYSTSMISMSFFSKTTLLGTYVKDGKLYHGEIQKCGNGGGIVETGLFDAWDSYRSINDRNISTKLSVEPFNLTLASINKDDDDTEVLSGKACKYHLKDLDTGDSLSDWETFDASNASTLDASFRVDSAHRKVAVEFKYCRTVGEPIEIVPLENCTLANTQYVWDTKLSSDAFAIRPNEFEILAPSGQDISLLHSGRDYNFTIKAESFGLQVEGYDQNKSGLTISNNLIDNSGNQNDTLEGNVSFGDNEFKFVDGITKDDDNDTEVVGVNFNDVGQVNIDIIDKNWAEVDNDDTPQDCQGGTLNGVEVPYGSYICGDTNTRFIPDHFELKDINVTNRRKDQNFTYLSDDLNMSAHIELRIEAVNANGDITKNFHDGNTTYYENPVEINITVPTTVTFPDGTVKNMTVVDKNVSKAMLGFGGSDANGVHTIAWDDSNETQRLLFNYQREVSTPINPFEINGTDVDVNVTSKYVSTVDSTITDNIKGGKVADQNATFVYARVKATKDFYDDIKTNSVKTPIKVEVYCDKWPASEANCPGVAVIEGATNNPIWFISTTHDMNSLDGNILLTIDSEGSLNADKPLINTADHGITEYITVTNEADTLPSTTHISLKIQDPASASPDYTDSWLVYDKDNTGATEIPLYKVRFVGSATWSGVGETGNVVGTDASSKKSKRLDW